MAANPEDPVTHMSPLCRVAEVVDFAYGRSDGFSGQSRHVRFAGVCTTMPTVFLSYRRSDSAEETKKIKAMMANRFGEDVVFRDEEAIPAGTDFRKAIEFALGDCIAMLVVIGTHWLATETESGERRLDDPKDFVRIEVESALSRSIPVVPVLVQDAAVPSSGELPESLKALATRNAVVFDGKSEEGVDRLCDDIAIQLWVKYDQHDKNAKERFVFRSLHGSTDIPRHCWLTREDAKWEVGAAVRDNLNPSDFGCLALVAVFLVGGVKIILGYWQGRVPQDDAWSVFVLGVGITYFAANFLYGNVKTLLWNTTVRIFADHGQILDGIPMLRRSRRFELTSLLRIQVEMRSLAIAISNDGFYRTMEFGSELPPDRRFFVLSALRRRLRELSHQTNKPTHPTVEVGHVEVDNLSSPPGDR